MAGSGWNFPKRRPSRVNRKADWADDLGVRDALAIGCAIAGAAMANHRGKRSMDRIEDIAPEKMTAAQKTVIDQLVAGRGRLLAPYRVWIHSPDVASRMESLGTYLNKRSTLTTREVEIGILVIARHWQSPYVIDAHVKLGMDAGMTREQVEAIRDGKPSGLTDPNEIAVHDFAAEIVGGAKLSDERFAEHAAKLGRDRLAEVLVLLGYYTSVALAMKIHDMPIPA
jgi:4-carboxymuconolactone decarboxylase